MSAVAACLIALALAPAAPAADRIFWTNISASASVASANLDGSGAGANLNTAGATSGNFRGVAIDVARNRLFWTSFQGKVSFANLDGTGGAQDLNIAGAVVSNPTGLAVDPVAGLVYWTDPGNNTIGFARADNTGGGGNLTITGTATLASPIGIAVDPVAGKIYWANPTPDNKISVANLDGSGSIDLNVSGATAPDNPQGVALDLVAQRIYWTSVYGQKISYTRLDNTGGGGDVTTAAGTVANPSGLAVDAEAGRVYWGNVGNSTLGYARLDNSGGGAVSTSGATANGVAWPALLKTPAAAGAPAIGGGSVAPATLTCSRGAWATDLLASFLFRAPGTFAFRWSRDGADVPGATGATLTATQAGTYRCTDVASNPAGSASQTSAAHVVAPAAVPPVTPPSAPVLSRLAIAPTAFRAADRGASAVAPTPASRGARVTLTLDVAASVGYRVTQRRSGRRTSAGRCAAPTRGNRGRPRCARVVTLAGAFTRAGAAGANVFRFTGRLGGRKLAPGSYRLVATPRALGLAGTSRSVAFRILAPPRSR
ncbi:MAG: hypothetical protein QOE65_1288 [Solirubrobacteraceae bacterium]|nr:hypothetical protein [Solirubrobacteraceae bacterium]